MSATTQGIRLTDGEIASMFANADLAAQFPVVLTPDQAAELLQVPKNTIYDWSSRGLLKGCARKTGKRLLILRDRLLKLVFNGGLTTP